MFIDNRRLFLMALTSVIVASSAYASDTYRVTEAEIVVVCPLTVGGSFEAKTRHVSGEVSPAPGQPGAVGGSLRVDLQTLQTGIAMRDRHMLENYLETAKGPQFAVATVEQLRIEKLAGKTAFKGMLTLHGQKQEVTGTADVHPQNGSIHVQAEFPIKVSEFEIPKPTYLGVGVKDEIRIRVSLIAVSG